MHIGRGFGTKRDLFSFIMQEDDFDGISPGFCSYVFPFNFLLFLFIF
jgi:hypothetical protein